MTIPDKNERACYNCIYFYYEAERKSIDESLIATKLECRRYAPRKLHGVGTGYEADKWPTIQPDDWCGEFES